MKQQNKYGKVTTIRIPNKLWELLEEEAELNFSSVASIVLKAVAFYFTAKGKIKQNNN